MTLIGTARRRAGSVASTSALTVTDTAERHLLDTSFDCTRSPAISPPTGVTRVRPSDHIRLTAPNNDYRQLLVRVLINRPAVSQRRKSASAISRCPQPRALHLVRRGCEVAAAVY